MKKLLIVLIVLLLCSCTAPKGINQNLENLKPDVDSKESLKHETLIEIVELEETEYSKEEESKSPSLSKDNTELKESIKLEKDMEPDAEPEVTISITGLDDLILDKVVVELQDKQTVFDILKKVTRDQKIPMDFSGGKTSGYIKGINNVYEFDMGPESGWLYKVNGIIPSVSSFNYELETEDVIEWIYVTELNID